VQTTLIYIGSLVIAVWGAGHLRATRAVVRGFRSESLENRRIITMEWILEGMMLCFLGGLASTIVATGHVEGDAGRLVIRACAAMLVAMAIVSAATGARTSIGPMRACPFVKAFAAILLVSGSLLR